MATELLKGYKSGLDFKREFEAEHPDFDPEAPLPESEEAPITSNWAGPPKGGQKRLELIKEHDATKRISHHLDLMEKDLVDVYARAPYDLPELKKLVLEILEEPDIADRIVATTKKQISVREQRMMEHDSKNTE